ncbi:hypothetical protein BDW62DRAFT_157973 [Aspergillus aurantiobrunneus]
MPFLQSCKSAACGIVPCCGRQPRPKFEPRYPGDKSPRVKTAAPSKGPFTRLKPWPKVTNPISRQSRRIEDRKATRVPEQHKLAGAASEEITQSILTYDIVMFGTESEKVVYRRLLLDCQVEFDAISDEIPRLLNLPIAPYNGLEVQLPNGNYVTPLGTSEVTWQLYKGTQQNTTKFLVIENSHFDMLLGRPSIQRYGLWEGDKNVQRKLKSFC